jgi:hypothetical protein
MHHAQRRFFDAFFDQQWKAGQIALQMDRYDGRYLRFLYEHSGSDGD